MYKYIIACAIFLCLQFSSASDICSTKSNCAECLSEFMCVWCASTDKAFDERRCIEKENSDDCPEKDLINPKSHVKILSDKPLQYEVNVEQVQIKPQNISLKLRVGEEYKFKFEYVRANNFPIDLYYMIDQSASMAKHIERLAALGDELIALMKDLTSDFKIGFGSFVDKVTLPYSSTEPNKLIKACEGCNRPYSFINHMTLSDGDDFVEELSKTLKSGNIDNPEGGFDALMQAMVCKEEIGWRDSARHLIIYSSDESFHIAGDGKLAGVVEPNDAQCHMTNHEYTEYSKYDYPSVSQIGKVALDKDINIFFTVANFSEHYEEIKNFIPNSQVDSLREDSKISQMVADFCKTLTANKDFKKIQGNEGGEVEFKILKISGNCTNTANGVCENIHTGNKLEIEASIKPLRCLKNKMLIINPGAPSEKLTVNIDVTCECDDLCSREEKSEKCNKHGALFCATCDCDQNYSGRECECLDTELPSKNSTACERDNKICSGRGYCECGICKCNSGYQGRYCECDNNSCENNCSGNGICECGKCKCNHGWSSKSCDCPVSIESCSYQKEICNNKGQCKCGKCQCEEGYYGTYCNECANCIDSRCTEIKPCVECTVFNTGIYKDECEQQCSNYNITTVDEITDVDSSTVKVCKIEINECLMIFKYFQNKQYSIEVESKLKCKTLDIMRNIHINLQRIK
ncbi:PREDICTED: integrin beta-PS-like [Nicrophorus vespilloides]|uniref:Integrin beta n=1 Tax=Nicrophorus vespilloides TaxID=110193 RepID=A0ABM1MML3_NICVS|nr:PREDICTED: integrin beta-PS-like [Nicrophorus vespilloides]